MVVGRKSCTHGTPCQVTDLAQAVHCLTQHGRVTVEQLATELATARFEIHTTCAQLYAWSNPYQPLRDLAMPIRVVRAITVLQGNPIVLEVLARDIQHRVEPMADVEADVARVRDEALDVQGAVGRASDQVRRITADGQITEQERAETRPVLRDLKRQTAELEAALERLA